VTVTSYTSGTVFYSLNTGTGINASATLSAGSAATFTGVWRAPQDNAYVVIQTSGSGGNLSVDDVSVLELAETDITNSINSTTWTRVGITNETITNPCVAIKLATSGDAIDVDYCQSEAGAFITSPIYTGSASVTRAVDNISASAYVHPHSATAGTMFVAARSLDANYGTTQTFLSLSDGTSGERFVLYRLNLDPWLIVSDGGVAQAGPDLGTFNSGTNGKLAASWALNDIAACFNAGTVQTDTGATLPTVHTIYFSMAGIQPHNGYTKQIMLLPRAMSDAELQAVTT
jgi:hypothetical protein